MTDQQKQDLKRGKWIAFGIIATAVALTLLDILISYLWK